MNRNRVWKKGAWAVGLALVIVTSIRFTGLSEGYFEVAKNLDIFTTLYKELNIYYVDETQPGDLIKTGIDAMLNSLDPYTVYYPESQIEDYRFMTTGQYGGIGALIRTRGENVMIAEPYEGFPAQEAGLRAGDRILEVNGKPAEGKTSSEMSKILKGQPNTKLELRIQREGVADPFNVEVTRKEIKIDDVPYYGVLQDNVGYIKLTGFTATASRDVKAALKDLKENQGVQSLVLDLRGNGGGLLQEAVNIVNLFVPRGQEVVHTKGKVKDWERSHKTLNEPYDLEIPLVVLIDRASASASEIVAGTIQDLDRGVVIGENSFGKGLVQQTRDLTYNTKMKVTVAKYYTPSGRCIQRLDYANKDDDGRAIEVADSLRTEYFTKNGRSVFDGAGIEPDLTVEVEKVAPISQVLVTENLIFDYATQYRNLHAELPAPEGFMISDMLYADFTAWLSDKDYDYTTRTEEMFEKLEAATKKEKYYDEIQVEYARLKDKLYHNKSQDLVKFQEQISKILENEIVSRYYYQEGRIRASLDDDEDIDKAIEVLNEVPLYSSILDGTYAKK